MVSAISCSLAAQLLCSNAKLLEIKLALTTEELCNDVRRAVKALKANNVNQATVAAQVWNQKKQWQERHVIAPNPNFTADEVSKYTELLVHHMDCKSPNVLTALTVCVLVLDDIRFREPLFRCGVVVFLMEILKALYTRADIAEMALLVISKMTYKNGNVCKTRRSPI